MSLSLEAFKLGNEEDISIGALDHETVLVITQGEAVLSSEDGEAFSIGSDQSNTAAVIVNRKDCRVASSEGCKGYVSITESSEPSSLLQMTESHVTVETRGEGNSRREVTTFRRVTDAKLRIRFGFTDSDGGNWSTYPPHKHDSDVPGIECKAEEWFAVELRTVGGFAIFVRYSSGIGESNAKVVRDGDLIHVADGYHTIVSAPGYPLRYWWFMDMDPELDQRYYTDPEHQWLLQD